jgi:hypothetical protein
MTVPKSVDPASFLREQLESASSDLLRDTVKTFADTLMSAEADAVCGAPYGARSDERVNSRNGYRAREWDTRAGTIELAIGEAALWLVLSRLAADPPPPRRARPRQRGGHVVPVGRVDPTGGETRRTAPRCAAVQEPGQRYGHPTGRPGRGVSQPAARRRAVHIRLVRRSDDQGPRSRPDRQRARAGRGRCQTPTAAGRSWA